MNKADWLTNVAALAGVLGIAIGWWWADALAATFISFDILHDGFKYMRAAIGDLMDRIPLTVEEDKIHPLFHRVHSACVAFPWVRQVEVRLREHGQFLVGEIFVVASDLADPVRQARDLQEAAYALDWRVHELVVQYVDTLPAPATFAAEREE